jgi:membrane dipeptidase
MNLIRPSVFISIFVLFFTAALFSQTVMIGGVVKDSATTSFIDSATVEIVNPAQPAEKYLVYTNSIGKWSYTFQNTGVENNPLTPSQFDLQQNFPNPFNPSTVIPFSIYTSGEVTLSIHTILGQKINERIFYLSPGTYNVRWTSSGAAGVLFYTLSFNGQSITRKMIQLDGNHGSGLGDALLVGGFTSLPSFDKKNATEYKVRTWKIGYEPDSVIVPQSDNQNINFSLSSVHHRTFVFDLHNDIAELMVGGYQIGVRHTINQSDIPRFIDGGIDGQMIVLWSDPNAFPTTAFQRTIQMYDTCVAQFNRNSATIAQATTISEIQFVHASGKIAAVLCVEGGHAIQENLNNLITFYNLGARYFTITWNNSVSWAISAADPQSSTKGLSEFGKQVIRTMDSLGMIIDVSHTGIKTIEDILATTKNPIIASHSGAWTLRNHYRNLTDDQIKAIAQGGGVIGVVFYTYFISSATASSVTIDAVIKHIDYIKNLVGIDHVAIGSDFDGDITAPVGLENVSKLPNLTLALLKHGYSPGDVRKILGENYLRVFKSVCQ